MAIAAEPEEIRVPAVPVPTDDLFRDDAHLREPCAASWSLDEGGVRLDRTVFYPQAAARRATAASCCWPTAARLAIADTRKGEERRPRSSTCRAGPGGAAGRAAAGDP